MFYESRTRARAGAGVLPYRSFLSRSLLLSLLAVAGCETAATKPLFDDDMPASLQISMARAELDRGDTARVQAVLLNKGGAPIGSPSAGAPRAAAPVTWASSDPSVAAISRSGLVSAHRGGEVTITATSGALTSISRLTVQPRGKLLTLSPKVDTLDVGHSLQLTATALDGTNREIPSTMLNWTSLQPAVAEVNGKGLVKAIATGTALIVAGSHGYADTARVVVGARTAWTLPIPAVGVVEVTPGEAVVELGTTRQLQATIKDGGGAPVQGLSPVWSSSDPKVAAVDGKGLLTSVAAGSATIRATVLGISGGSAITVSNPAPPAPVVTTVEVTPATATVEAGQAVQLSVTVRDQNNAVMNGVAVTWSSGNAAVATVDANGRVTGVAGGIASIRATADGKNGVAAVTVVAPAPPPAPPAPPAGQTYPNQPAGHLKITEHSGGPWPADWWKHDPQGNILTEAGGVVRFRHRAGLPGGDGPGMMGHGWGNSGAAGNLRAGGQPVREIYLSFEVELPSNWHMPLANQTKLMYMYAVDATGNSRHVIIPLVVGPSGSSAYGLWMQNDFNGVSNLSPNIRPDVMFVPGRKHRVELVLRNATTDGGTGSARWWIDGVLVGDHPAIPRPNRPWTEIHWNPVWGGGGGFVQQEMELTFRGIYASGR